MKCNHISSNDERNSVLSRCVKCKRVLSEKFRIDVETSEEQRELDRYRSIRNSTHNEKQRDSHGVVFLCADCIVNLSYIYPMKIFDEAGRYKGHWFNGGWMESDDEDQ